MTFSLKKNFGFYFYGLKGLDPDPYIEYTDPQHIQTHLS